MIATMKNDQDARYSVVELCLALGVSRSGFYDHKQKQIASADARMAFWRKRSHCSFWKGAVLTVRVVSKRACCAQGLRVAKSGSFG